MTCDFDGCERDAHSTVTDVDRPGVEMDLCEQHIHEIFFRRGRDER